MKEKLNNFVSNHPQAVDFAKTFATTVVTIVVIQVAASLVSKGIELGIEKLTGSTSEQETPAE